MSDAGKPASSNPETGKAEPGRFDTKALLDEFRAKLAPKAYRWKQPEPAAAAAAPKPAPPQPAAQPQPAASPEARPAPTPPAEAVAAETVAAAAPPEEPVADASQPLAVAADADSLAAESNPPQAMSDPAAAEQGPSTLHNEVARALDELKADAGSAAADAGRPAALEAMAQSIESLAREIETRDSAADPQVAPSATMPAPPDAPKGGNLLADVRAVAAGWFRNGRAADSNNRGPGDVAMPEELTAAAADRGVSVSFSEKSLKALNQRDFPCIALDKAGGSHILVGKPDKATLLRKEGNGAAPIKLGTLQKIFSGVVFFVRPKPEPASDTTSAASSRMSTAAPESSETAVLKGIFRTVAAEMLATQKPLLLQLVLATVLSNLFMFAMPLFSMAVYDRVVPHLAWETLWALSLGVMIVLIADFAIRYIRLKLMDSVGLSTATALQTRLFSRLMHGKLKDLPTQAGGVANGIREVEALCHVVPAVTIAIAIDLPFFILATVLIYSIAGFVAITPILGALLLIAIHIGPLIGADIAQKHSRYVGTQTNAVLEAMGAIESVKVTGAERVLLRRWERLVDTSAFASHLNRLQGSLATQSSVVISQAVVVVAMIIGVYEISTGAMTIGAMTAAVLLIGRMMAPVSQLMSFIHRAHQLASASKTMMRIFTVPQEAAGDSSEAREEMPILGHIAFRNVSFTYPGEEVPSLDAITLDIRPGEKVGLIGRVGSGKSSLLRLILRLHEPTSGTMLVDDRDARQVSPRALRRVLGFMRQDSVLFDDTLQANICFGMETMRAADFERAVTVSGVKDFAARHPAGYGMRVGARGERLSGGERQSVALARMLAENPKVFILDEPTAAMDNALEARVVRDLREMIADKTFIVATHRAPLLSLVDRIIWMENGRIVADGPKAEVMQRLSQAA